MALKTSSQGRRKLLMAARAAKTVVGPALPPVWVLTDPKRMPDPVAVAETLPQGWGMIYRHFGHAEREAIAADLRRATAARDCWLLIAADPSLAKLVGADGVHWPERLRRQAAYWRRAFPIMTSSSHTPLGLRALRANVFDAALVSTVFSSQSPTAGEAMGPIKLRHLARTAHLPIYGLGGVNSKTAQCIASQSGLAMVEGGLTQG